jgi:proline iminopeptidase
LAGADKTAPALIALHGGPGASHLCFEFLDPLADQRPVVIYDQLGCGKSDHPNDLSLWTIERAVEELDQLIKGLGFKKVHLLGHSWGCILAFEYMLRKQPNQVVGLVLAGPCMSASRWIEDGHTNLTSLSERMQKAVRAAEASQKFDGTEYQEAMDAYYHRYLCRLDPWPSCLKEAIDSVNTTIYNYMWGPSEFTATGTLKGYEKADRLKEIKVPTLFTCGEFDEASPATTRYYSSLLPGSEVVVFQGASHCHLFEQPDKYVSTLRAFLIKAEGRETRLSR